jgi:dihydropyrimidine dehydrogenase (NAD+) subunit PreT
VGQVCDLPFRGHWEGYFVTGAKGLAEEHPPLSPNEAVVEANRCLFCYDAPCTHACPTHIDIPRFIKKIATDNLIGSARTILDSNLLGATCARVCPVEELCEGACVLGKDHKPIMIGRLQRHAMDSGAGLRPANPIVKLAPKTGRHIAVVGSGPASLSCAGELVRRGHDVTVFEKRPLAGGLSTYGIIALREPMEASLQEVRMLERLGVRIQTGVELGGTLALDDLRSRFDAVFLGLGLGATPAMGIPGEEWIVDGLEYIEESKLKGEGMAVGRNVVVIGAGNTAIDCATVARRLGASTVMMVYRRSEREVSAYPHERDFIRKEGVEFRFLTQPVRVIVEDGRVTGLGCIPMKLGVLEPAGGPEFIIPADQVVKAVGQEKPSLARALGLALQRGYIQVNADFETSIPGVFAGGDCIRSKNIASTVMAVQDGKLAAAAIHARLGLGQVGQVSDLPGFGAIKHG